jgi:hypothetical protein
MCQLKNVITILLILVCVDQIRSQGLKLEVQNKLVVLKNQDQPIDTLINGGGSIIDYKIISRNEVILIKDNGVSTCYYHLINVNNMWTIKLITGLGQTPQQRLKYSSAIPKDYWEIKDKIVTFKLLDVEKVEIYENGIKTGDVNFEAIKQKRQAYLDSGKKMLDSLQTKKN